MTSAIGFVEIIGFCFVEMGEKKVLLGLFRKKRDLSLLGFRMMQLLYGNIMFLPYRVKPKLKIINKKGSV